MSEHKSEVENTAYNHVMFQSFHWNSNGDGKFYERLAGNAKRLSKLGIHAAWLPPATKATGTNDVGYGVYDLYDLGEFDHHGEVRTKYGTKEEYLNCIKALHDESIDVYADVVINHKAGADETERIRAVQVNPDNREEAISEPHDIEAWTKFTFPGRGDTYSDFKWNWTHFTGVDFDNASGTSGIFRLLGEDKDWADGVSDEKGNFDYLMFADIDHDHPDVREELKRWAKWYIEECNLDGFRMDAAKHIEENFMHEFVGYIEGEASKDFFVFGEYWLGDLGAVLHYLDETDHQMDLFDVPLHFNFFTCANDLEGYDLRKIFDNTLVQSRPLHAITFVDNHDTEPGQSLESWIPQHFKPMAYALILLRKDGYPCVFSADFDIADDSDLPDHKMSIEKLLELRQLGSRGDQIDYFVDAKLIGWLRTGEGEDRNPMAVVYASTDQRAEPASEEDYEFARAQAEAADNAWWLDNGRFIVMDLGQDQAGRVFADAFADVDSLRITVAEDGRAAFPVPLHNPAIWVPEEIAGVVLG